MEHLGRRGLVVAALVVTCGRGSTALSASITLTIQVQFSSDRSQTGTLSLLNSAGETLAGPFDAYGRADNHTAIAHGNVGRRPTLPYGDTPTGTYAIPRATATGDGTKYNSKSYGPNGALVLQPTGGEAEEAARNGRVGLLIHGGDPDSSGRLRATNGCVRLSNADIKALLDGVARAGENALFNRCEMTQIDASIGPPGAPDTNEDVGDPPPGIEALLRSGPILP
jgi:hypothetical protein